MYLAETELKSFSVKVIQLTGLLQVNNLGFITQTAAIFSIHYNPDKFYGSN